MSGPKYVYAVTGKDGDFTATQAKSFTNKTDLGIYLRSYPSYHRLWQSLNGIGPFREMNVRTFLEKL